MIQAAAAKKARKAQELNAARKPYPHGTGLLIYLNIQDVGAHQHEIEPVFQAAVEPAKCWFPSIWILWKALAYHIFPGDETETQCGRK